MSHICSRIMRTKLSATTTGSVTRRCDFSFVTTVRSKPIPLEGTRTPCSDLSPDLRPHNDTFYALKRARRKSCLDWLELLVFQTPPASAASNDPRQDMFSSHANETMALRNMGPDWRPTPRNWGAEY